MKKLFTLILAIILCLSLSVPAFAEDSTTETTQATKSNDIMGGVVSDTLSSAVERLSQFVNLGDIQGTIASALGNLNLDITDIDTSNISSLVGEFVGLIGGSDFNIDSILDTLSTTELLKFFTDFYSYGNVVETTTAAETTEETTEPEESYIPDTGYGSTGIAVAAALTISAAAAFVLAKKKEQE